MKYRIADYCNPRGIIVKIVEINDAGIFRDNLHSALEALIRKHETRLLTIRFKEFEFWGDTSVLNLLPTLPRSFNFESLEWEDTSL